MKTHRSIIAYIVGMIAWAIPVSGQNIHPAGIDCNTISIGEKDGTSNVNYFPYIPYQYKSKKSANFFIPLLTSSLKKIDLINSL